MFGEMVARTLRETWAVAEELKLPTAVMGGIALSASFHPRNTRDVDLLVGIDGTNPESLLAALESRRYRPIRTPALTTVGVDRFFQFYYTPLGAYVDIKVDMLLAESPLQREALRRRIPVDWANMQLHVEAISCEDLILFKLAAGRPIDEADVVALILANRDHIDYAYLRKWLPQIQRVGRWGMCWRRAVPDRADPTASV
jgi:hypothetical protein